MGLPAAQQRVLERIEGRLAESDPRLAALFAVFSRLTRAETMPWAEQLRARPVLDRVACAAHGCRALARRRAARVRALVLLPAVTAIACALMIAFSFPNGQRAAVHGVGNPSARVLLVGHRICRFGMARVPVLAC
jgi:hypothetical protein